MSRPTPDREADRLDRELLGRTAAGDDAAFAAFVGRHEAAVLRFCQTLVRQPAAAEDALQETFLAAWRKANTFRGEGSARSWLFTIARRWVYRLTQREPPASGEGSAPIEDLAVKAGWGVARDSEDWKTRLDDRIYLEQAFARLARNDREVILLRDVEGFSASEAAEVLGIEVPVLKSRLHRARLRLTALVGGGDQNAR